MSPDRSALPAPPYLTDLPCRFGFRIEGARALSESSRCNGTAIWTNDALLPRNGAGFPSLPRDRLGDPSDLGHPIRWMAPGTPDGLSFPPFGRDPLVGIRKLIGTPGPVGNDRTAPGWLDIPETSQSQHLHRPRARKAGKGWGTALGGSASRQPC